MSMDKYFCVSIPVAKNLHFNMLFFSNLCLFEGMITGISHLLSQTFEFSVLWVTNTAATGPFLFFLYYFWRRSFVYHISVNIIITPLLRSIYPLKVHKNENIFMAPILNFVLFHC